ncbi:MAG: DUF1731 domain-containing protein [Winogradskyella sp.]
MKLLKLIGHVSIITLLTLVTQVGGLIWIVTLLISHKLKKKKRLVFPLLYLVFNLIIVPPIASYFGREQLPVLNQNLKPINWFYPLAFRNYVLPKLKQGLIKTSENLASSNISITYLDANFPFIEGYPLLPHLSHNDGLGKQWHGKQKVSWIHETDFARSIEFLIEQNLEGVFNIVAPKPTTNKHLMEVIRKALKMPFGVSHPKWLLQLGAKMIGTESELVLKSRNVIPQNLVANGFKFQYLEIESTIENLVKT